MRYRASPARIASTWILLIAEAAFSPAHAQCGVTGMVHWAESIAFESAYDPATML